MDVVLIYAALFLLIAMATPFISILPLRQAAVQIYTPRLAGAHPSHGCRRGCRPCSLPTAALTASKEPHCARHDRGPTAADARPTLFRHVPRLITPLLFPANAGTTLTPPSSSLSDAWWVTRRAATCLVDVHLAVVTPAMPSHAATFPRQRRHHPS